MRGIMVSIYLCIYVSISLSIYLFCIIYPAFVAPWSPRSVYALKCSSHVFRYNDVLMCVIYNCMHWMTGATHVCCKDYRQRQVGEFTQTHGINGFSLLRQWSSHGLPRNLPMHLCMWIKNEWWAYCTAVLWRSYRQRRNTIELTTVRPECYLWI